MNELLNKQICPYCEYEVEEHLSAWEYESEEEVECSNCEKVYISKPQYQFEGWMIEKRCEICEEFTEDGYTMCDCLEI